MNSYGYIVAVGGTNIIKIAAVQDAFDRYDSLRPFDEPMKVCGSVAASSAPDQPFGLQETAAGAATRALRALGATPNAGWGVGIENGILHGGVGLWVDVAVVAVINSTNYKPTFATSVGIPCPGPAFGGSVSQDQAVTAGSAIATKEGCDPADWHKHFTGGLLDRKKLLTDAVFTALCLRFNGR